MLPFQLAGRKIQVLERFTPLGRLFGAASRNYGCILRRRFWNQGKTGAPAGKKRFPGRRMTQRSILTGAVPWIGVTPSSSMPSRVPTVSPFRKFILLTLKWHTRSGSLSWLTSLRCVSQ